VSVAIVVSPRLAAGELDQRFRSSNHSRAALEAEILVLRHQLNVLRRKSPGRLAFSSTDRLVFAACTRWLPTFSTR
jgi:hypothetical protein